MGQSRHRSRSSNWSSAPCLVALNFLCYGNACSMLLDRYRAFTRSLSSSVCALYFSSCVSSRQFKHVRFILSCWLSVASRLTYFGEGPYKQPVPPIRNADEKGKSSSSSAQ